MRRVFGLMAAAALVVALSFEVAQAAELGSPSERTDLASQLMLQLFGETSDSTASFAAAHGDRTSESPFRELALEVPSNGARQQYAPGVAAAFAQDRLALSDLSPSEVSDVAVAAQFNALPSVIHFAAPSLSDDSATLIPSSPHYTAAYQPAAAVPAISPAPGTLAFAPPDADGFDLSSSTAQIGAVQFEGSSATSPVQSSQSNLHDASYGAAANFDLRAGKRNLNVNLSSEYEQIAPNEDTMPSVSQLGSAPSWQLPSAGAPLATPDYGGLSRLSLGAGLSVPVVHGLTLNLNYDAQRLYGGYGLPGLVNLDTINNTYGGGLTFNIPRISSSLSIGAYQDRLQDSLLLNGSTQTREDVNFTVKF